MRKELEEVREALKDARIAHDMSHANFCDESHWRDEFNQHTDRALTTLDRLLNQSEAELVEKCAKEMCSAWGYNWDGDAEIDDDAIPVEDNYIDERPSKQTFREASTAALRAIGLIGSE